MTAHPLQIIADVLGSEVDGVRLLAALQANGWVCVPITPTAAMIKAGWADALAEDTKAVWEAMIGEFISN